MDGMRDDGAARRQRGGRLAGQHRRGEVPGRDQRGHPDRLAPDLDLGIGQVRGDALDVRAAGLLGVELDEARGIVDLAACLRDRLALLGGHDPRQILAMGDHQLEPAAQDRRALLRQAPGPIRPGLVRGAGGTRGRRRVQAGDAAQYRAAGRVGHRGPPLGADPLAGERGIGAQQGRLGQAGQDRVGTVNRLGHLDLGLSSGFGTVSRRRLTGRGPRDSREYPARDRKILGERLRFRSGFRTAAGCP